MDPTRIQVIRRPYAPAPVHLLQLRLQCVNPAPRMVWSVAVTCAKDEPPAQHRMAFRNHELDLDLRRTLVNSRHARIGPRRASRIQRKLRRHVSFYPPMSPPRASRIFRPLHGSLSSATQALRQPTRFREKATEREYGKLPRPEPGAVRALARASEPGLVQPSITGICPAQPPTPRPAHSRPSESDCAKRWPGVGQGSALPGS